MSGAPQAIQAETLATAFDAIVEQLSAKLMPRLRAKLSEQSDVEPRLFTVREAAIYLGRSASAVEHLIQEKKINPVRIDRRVQIDRRDLDALIDRSKDGAI